MPHNQQAVEQTKRDCRYDEQIHRGDAVGMIAKERSPALGWRVSSPGHVLGHAGLSDIDEDLEEFSMDPRRSPQRIGKSWLCGAEVRTQMCRRLRLHSLSALFH